MLVIFKIGTQVTPTLPRNAEPGGDVGHRGLAHTISCRRPRGHRAADPADFTPAVRR
jgi:hypothetical protein